SPASKSRDSRFSRLPSRGFPLHAADPSSRTKKWLLENVCGLVDHTCKKNHIQAIYHQPTKPTSEASTTGAMTPSKTSYKYGLNKPAEHTAQRPWSLYRTLYLVVCIST